MNLWAETATQLKRWEGLAVVGVAVGCIVFQLRVPSTSPTDADYQAAAAKIDQEYQPGDAVLLAPWFIERARIFVPERVPVIGYYGSDGADLTQHPRIWVLANPSLPGFSFSSFLDSFQPKRTEDGPASAFGHLELRRYRNGRSRAVLFSAAQSLGGARIFLQTGQGEQACQFNGRSWRCPNGGEVVEEWRELHFEPHRCLRFYPPGGPSKLVAEFSNVPAANLLQLVTGYIWERGAYRNVDSTEVGFEVNGASEVTTLLPGVEKVYRIEKTNTPAGPVRVWVQANNPAAREVCFELFALGPEGA